MNVHDGHNASSLQRDVVKCYTPNDSVLNNLITADYMMIGISQLCQILGGILTPHFLCTKGIGETSTPLFT